VLNIVLQPLNINDAEDLFKIGANDRIWKFMTLSLKTLEDFRKFVKSEIELAEKGESIPFVVSKKNNNELIGFTKLYNIDYTHRTVSSGLTWINPLIWNKGINIQIKLILLEYCFEDLDMRRVQYIVDENNIRSQKSLKRMNAKFEGVFRNFRNYPNGLYKNSFIYSHIVEEWESTKQHLITLLV
jgi:RimJ/RimL family protein N-acetyltransferase